MIRDQIIVALYLLCNHFHELVLTTFKISFRFMRRAFNSLIILSAVWLKFIDTILCARLAGALEN